MVTGARGQLGGHVLRRAPDALALGSAELDITDAAAVAEVIEPGDVVLNCAAYTAVDRAESEIEAAFAVNEQGPLALAAACAAVGARLIHVSTDYVFAGDASTPYAPTAKTAPINVYGRSKLAGEVAVRAALPGAQIVRTAWVYSGVGSDFVATMLRKECAGDTVRVVADSVGSPTYAGDLAAGLVELVGRPDAPTLLHTTGGGTATWYDLARAVFDGVGADPARVQPCARVDYPTPAARPAYSVLSGQAWAAAGLTPLRPWPQALAAALATVAEAAHS